MSDTSAVAARMTALTTLREMFPESSAESILQLVEWVDSGKAPLSATGIERAAKVVATATGSQWATIRERNIASGIAVQAIGAYFSE